MFSRITTHIVYCPLGAFYPTDYDWEKKKMYYVILKKIIIFVLNKLCSLSIGPTVLISYITVLFYKSSSVKTLFFYCWSFTVESVFSPVHDQCKLHAGTFYITLVNTVQSYNKNVSWLFLVVILGKTVGGHFPPLYPIIKISFIAFKFSFNSICRNLAC